MTADELSRKFERKSEERMTARTELERYKEAVRVARDELHTIYSTAEVTAGKLTSACAEKAYDEINLILNPPPVYEEVTVERYVIIASDGEERWYGLGSNPGIIEGEQIVKLTGTRRVQVAQKVERSVSVEGVSCPFAGNPETFGKTGTLTFTWEE